MKRCTLPLLVTMTSGCVSRECNLLLGPVDHVRIALHGLDPHATYSLTVVGDDGRTLTCPWLAVTDLDYSAYQCEDAGWDEPWPGWTDATYDEAAGILLLMFQVWTPAQVDVEIRRGRSPRVSRAESGPLHYSEYYPETSECSDRWPVRAGFDVFVEPGTMIPRFPQGTGVPP